MGTKWKSKAKFIIWLLLFTYGISGILSALIDGSYYTKSSYFETSEFHHEQAQFIELLSIYEFNPMTKEEMKKAITVTDEDIYEHRNRYGDLAEQVLNITSQYEDKISEALGMDQEGIADVFMVERDKKIEDTTNNYKSDDHVRAKVMKEKEERIDDYFHNKGEFHGDFNSYSEAFAYYFKDTTTGEIFTNLNISNEESLNGFMTKGSTLYFKNFTPSSGHYFWDFGNMETIIGEHSGKLEGQIGVQSAIPATHGMMLAIDNYNQKQIIFLFLTITSIVALIVSLEWIRKSAVIPASFIEKWKPYDNSIPFDMRLILFGAVVTMTIISMFWFFDSISYVYPYQFHNVRDLILSLVTTSVFAGVVLIETKLLFERVKVWSILKKDWESSFLYRAYQILREAFLLWGTGVQLLIILGVIFIFGIVTGFAFVDEVFVLIWALMLLIAIPVIILLLKLTGYFNQIFTYTRELSQGNLGADLSVKGKSVLAKLAGNINILKQGVKTSQNEQAKSERLKTELITNVSHDLRTPLTSIITYTELLKTPNLSNEESQTYIEIIDRKSQRLKGANRRFI